MATTSDHLALTLQATGENNNTWGEVLNTQLIAIENKLSDTATISSTGGTTVLSTAQEQTAVIKCDGTLVSNITLECGTRVNQYLVWNATSGAYTVTLKTNAGTGITVPQGEAYVLACDGTNVVQVPLESPNTYIASLLADTSPQLGGFLDPNANYIGMAKGGDIASASPLVIDTDGDFFDVTGTTGFSAMTVAANRFFVLQFDGALTITHGASLLLPTAANITTEAGDRALFFSTGADTVICLAYTRADGAPLTGTDTELSQGTHTIWIPAVAWYSATTNGAASYQAETTAGRPDIKGWAFDDGTDEYVQCAIAMPKSWNEGTVTFRVHWTTTATGTTGVSWGLQGVAVSDGDTIDVAYGTAVVVDDDAQSAAEDVLVSPTSGAVTIAGTPAAGDLVFLQLFRDVSDSNDDMTEDAILLGVEVFVTLNAANDD